MEDILEAVALAPVANLFIIGGLFFLAVAVLGKINGKIEPGRRERIWAAILGGVLIISGLGLHLGPSLASRPASASAPEGATAVPATSTASPALVAAETSPTPAPPASLAPATATPAAADPTAASAAPATVAPTEAPAVSAPTLAPGGWTRLSDLPRAINALVVDPGNAGVLYAGTGENGSGSGVFRSTDAGQTWQPASEGLPGEDVKALAISTAAPAALYAVVGGGADATVYISTDGAASWTRLSNGGVPGLWYDLCIDPGNGSTLYLCACPGKLVRSLDGGHSWQPLRDGLPGDERETHILSLAIDPTDSNVLYAGTGAWVGGGQGVFKSTDGGVTWSPANRGMMDYRITAVAIDPGNAQRVYAGGYAGEVFVSEDGGQTWTDLTGRLPYDTAIHPTVQQIVLDPAGAVYLLCDQFGIVISTDGGASWRVLGAPEPDLDLFTALAVVPGPQPALVMAVERQGGWRYAP